jgi:hypothetical protein
MGEVKSIQTCNMRIILGPNIHTILQNNSSPTAAMSFMRNTRQSGVHKVHEILIRVTYSVYLEWLDHEVSQFLHQFVVKACAIQYLQGPTCCKWRQDACEGGPPEDAFV